VHVAAAAVVLVVEGVAVMVPDDNIGTRHVVGVSVDAEFQRWSQFWLACGSHRMVVDGCVESARAEQIRSRRWKVLRALTHKLSSPSASSSSAE
jgi:hypothetical protein